MTETTDEKPGISHAVWYDSARSGAPERARLAFDLDIDVCVIGGGLAGLTAAREIAKRGWSVAVIEANRVAWGASGRNTGFVLPGFQEDIDRMVERVGLDHTKQLWALSEEGLEYVRHTIGELGRPDIHLGDGWLHVSKTDDGKETQAFVERMRWIGANVEAWTTSRVRSVLPSPYYFNAVHYPTAFHIDPLKYALALAADAEAAGARIFENTPAVSIDTAGIRKRVMTPAGRVRAAHVVLACNVNLDALIPRLGATVLPITTYVLMTQPLGRLLHDVIKYKGGVSDTERADNHYRIIDDGDPSRARLQWLGRLRLWKANPRWIVKGLIDDIRRNFPDLGHVEAENIWEGTSGRAIHGMPQIGEAEPGVWLAGGFAGHGLNTTALAGNLIARGIVEGDQTWRLFSPYELVWAGGTFARIAAQTYYWAQEPVLEVKQGLARARERRRDKRAAKAAARGNIAIAEQAWTGQGERPPAGEAKEFGRRKGSRRKNRPGRPNDPPA